MEVIAIWWNFRLILFELMKSIRKNRHGCQQHIIASSGHELEVIFLIFVVFDSWGHFYAKYFFYKKSEEELYPRGPQVRSSDFKKYFTCIKINFLILNDQSFFFFKAQIIKFSTIKKSLQKCVAPVKVNLKKP